MTQYRKKPVVIAASQWRKNGDHPLDYSKTHPWLENGELRNFLPEERKANGWEGDIVRYYRTPDMDGETPCGHCGVRMHEHGWIDTLEGGHIVCPGDWIITGVKGEHYPCKPDIFAATYDAAYEVPAQYTPTFQGALAALKDGHRVARSGWNGKGMFAYMVPAASYPVQTGAAKAHFGEGSLVPYNAYFALKGVDETISTWVPSVSDLLAEDWHVIE
jgi:hypothetical protein